MWHREFKSIIPSLAYNEAIGQMRLLDVATPVVMVFFVALLFPPTFVAVYKECRRTGRSFAQALSQLSFMALSTFAAYAWLWSPHTRARTEHFILFHVTIGIAFGKMATKIILAHLTKKPFPQFTGLMFPLLLGALLFNLPSILPPALIDVSWLPRYEIAYLWAYLAMVVIGYANWIYHVINSFCAFLDINCLTIKGKRKVSIEVVVDSPSSSVQSISNAFPFVNAKLASSFSQTGHRSSPRSSTRLRSNPKRSPLN
jgi:ethanolaminephosphotransferase